MCDAVGGPSRISYPRDGRDMAIEWIGWTAMSTALVRCHVALRANAVSARGLLVAQTATGADKEVFGARGAEAQSEAGKKGAEISSMFCAPNFLLLYGLEPAQNLNAFFVNALLGCCHGFGSFAVVCAFIAFTAFAGYTP